MLIQVILLFIIFYRFDKYIATRRFLHKEMARIEQTLGLNKQTQRTTIISFGNARVYSKGLRHCATVTSSRKFLQMFAKKYLVKLEREPYTTKLCSVCGKVNSSLLRQQGFIGSKLYPSRYVFNLFLMLYNHSQ
jgi:hypothetical protein